MFDQNYLILLKIISLILFVFDHLKRYVIQFKNSNIIYKEDIKRFGIYSLFRGRCRFHLLGNIFMKK